uniref:PHC2 protein n=1 Tax=Nothoprocta perdicaria TaxID=30464 RepID=A0A8C6ZII8_NOTPE
GAFIPSLLILAAMENEQLPAPGGGTGTGGTGGGTGRPPGPQISVYSGLPDRQTVIQQALHRQPSTAAQYLQQMYAAQQQHLMLQTAALQQQHLTSAQLQSLAAVQQPTVSPARPPRAPTCPAAAPSPLLVPQINLAAAPAAAQLLNRAQSVNSAASGIAQQAVLLGNAASPALTASQAQMYLRAQMVSAARPPPPPPPGGSRPGAAARGAPHVQAEGCGTAGAPSCPPRVSGPPISCSRPCHGVPAYHGVPLGPAG